MIPSSFRQTLTRLVLLLVCSLAPVASAASIPVTAQAIRIPAENLAAILPGGLDMETIDPAVMRRIEKAVQLEKAFVEAKWRETCRRRRQPGSSPRRSRSFEFKEKVGRWE